MQRLLQPLTPSRFRLGVPVLKREPRPGKGRLMALGATAVSLGLLLATPAMTSAAGPGNCVAGKIRTASGCTPRAAADRKIDNLVRQVAREDGLRAALVRVDIKKRTVSKSAIGNSMAGQPANHRMHFRIGSVAIPHLIDLLLQLQDRSRLSLDDPVSNWFPGLPNADQVTLRMLASSTSGYPDWIQGNPVFIEAFLDNPFRQWKTQELVAAAFARENPCDPGECFSYAHTNFVIIERIIRKVTGRPVARLIRKRVLKPLGLRQTNISAFPAIPAPTLHAYVSDRGPYEDSTSWSPSWTIGKSTIMTSTTGNMIKAAKAFGTGALISRKASRQRFAPITANLAPFNDDFYYGLGILVSNGWKFQNPELNGYTAIAGYLPSRRMSLAIVVTNGRPSAATGDNYSVKLFTTITRYLTPGHPSSSSG